MNDILIAPRTTRTPKTRKPELPSGAEYQFWRTLAENVAYLRQVQETARARQACATQLVMTFEGAA